MLEIACFNLESAHRASEAGADRIELCAEHKTGGITPSLKDVELLQSKVNIPIFVMIRPRSGDFLYTDPELERMRDDVLHFKDIADGFVFGVLDKDGKVNMVENTQLVALANPKPCTFHRAFDQTPDLFQALEDVIQCGFHQILTSGAQTNAIAGMETIAKLIEQSKDRITIMPGGGVRSANAKQFRSIPGCQWLHSSAIVDDGEIADVHEMQAIKAHS